VIAHIDLDHLAVASARQSTAWPRYAGDLGGTWVAGGFAYGFRSAQVRFRHGMKVEVIAPHNVEQNDFLQRFLDRSGPGPHHLTYKVGDIVEALAIAEEHGYPPVNVDLSDPDWKEGFLHPKSAHGIVIQLAQAQGEWTGPPPDDFPSPRPSEPADLVRVVHLVAALGPARDLFEAVLGGNTNDEGDGWVELEWPGSGRVRIVEAATPADHEWLAGGPGRVHHVAFATEDPGGIADARPLGDGSFEIAAADNLGTRLRLVEG
jgi:methylmalonyl-CoA/ethylmalonyl-CoA epimerase